MRSRDPKAQAICTALTSKPLDAAMAFVEGMAAGVDLDSLSSVESLGEVEESGPILTTEARRAYGAMVLAWQAFEAGDLPAMRRHVTSVRTFHEETGDRLARSIDAEMAKRAGGARPPKAKRLTRQDSVRRGYEQMAAAEMTELRGVSPASMGVDNNGRTGR